MARFSEIIGHEGIVRNLRTAIRCGQIAHACIFDGSVGIGKKTLANAYVQTLFCEEKDSDGCGRNDACGRCDSCRTFLSGSHPDIHYVSAIKIKSIGVDDIREQMLRPLETKPYRYPYKVFIMNAAHTMTPAAQNALLKAIEEPPPYGIFIFLSENLNLFLPTILSRCVVFKCKPIPEPAVKKYLLSEGMDEDNASFYAAYSQGSIGAALVMARSESLLEMRGVVSGMTQALRRLDVPETLAQFVYLEKFKDDIQVLLDLFMLWYRDAIVVKETGERSLITQSDKQNEIYAQAQATAITSLYNKFDAVWQAKHRLKQNGNFQLTLEMMLLHLAG